MTHSNNASKIITSYPGSNVKRLRELLGITQDYLVKKLGGNWTRHQLSVLEGKTNVRHEQIEELAKALKIPTEAISNFDEKKSVYNIQNNYDHTSNPSQHYHPGFDPLDKFIEALEKNDSLVADNQKLYEALLQAERDKTRLERDKNELIIRFITAGLPLPT